MSDYAPSPVGSRADRHAQDAVRALLERGVPKWFDGSLVENVRLSTASNAGVPHRLRRKPRGFVVLGLSQVTATPADPFSVIAVSHGQQTTEFALICASTIEVMASFWFW